MTFYYGRGQREGLKFILGRSRGGGGGVHIYLFILIRFIVEGEGVKVNVFFPSFI
jgi:hypothetical protein